MKLTDVGSAHVEFGQGMESLLGLIDAWAGRVLKLFFDTDPGVDPNDGSTWTINDLVGALYLRDAVERGLRDLAQRRGRSMAEVAAVRAVDELFKTFTADDKRGVVQLTDTAAPSSPWWWRRLPVTGPVATEADEIAHRLGK